MRIDLTCPVELWQYALPAGDAVECTFVLNNLSDKVVTSVQVTLVCFDRDNNLLFKQMERIRGLKAGVGERFSIVILPTQWGETVAIDLVIEKVWFDDATIWRRGNASMTAYAPNNLPPGRVLDQLRFVAGVDAVGYPQAQEQVWLCVCGRANPIDSIRCCRCERKRESVFASFSPENVQQVISVHEQKLAEAARRAREENSAITQTQEKQKLAKTRVRKQVSKAFIAVAIVAVFVGAAFLWGVPAIKYNAALDQLRNGRYTEARAAFSEMNGYSDTEVQLLDCDYQEAMTSLRVGTQEELEKAVVGFAALGDYEDSFELWRQSVYELGDIYLEAGKYDLAAEMFQSLDEYEDSEDKYKETTYRQANVMLEGGNYLVAQLLFRGIEDYKDAATKVQECAYQVGKSSLEAAEYDEAITLLSTLDGYSDSLLLAGEARYELAEAKFAAGEYEEAGILYLESDGYADATAKANDCLYQLAQEKKSAGEYEKASELFLRIPEYLDSEGQAITCSYEVAVKKKGLGDYEGAAALFETVAEYDDASDQLHECNYHMALAAITAEDLTKAETLLENANGYEDSEKQLRTVRYELAEKLLTDGNYEEALARYEELGSYKESATKLKQCRYELAKAKLEQKDYQAAIDQLSLLGGYEDSKTLLEDATYQLALASKETGDTDTAIDLLKNITDNEEAAKELSDLALKDARALQEAGDFAGASTLYLALSDIPGATEGYNACQYAIANQLMVAQDWVAAGDVFIAISDYLDANTLAEECYAQKYGALAETARISSESQNYPAVIVALETTDLETLPSSYQDLAEIYNNACYEYAEQLYSEDKPYEALPYYQRIEGYKDVADKKLGRRAYLILGNWVSTTEKTAEFRTDGTCDLLGETLCFRVNNFSLYTGTAADQMALTYKVSNLNDESLSLRDIRDGKDVLYKFDRVSDANTEDANADQS